MNEMKLAGYLAVHHHRNNLAMLITNPSPKVRLLLSYVIFGLRQDLGRLSLGMRYRAVIGMCQVEVENTARRFRASELSGAETARLVDLYLKKASMAHAKLLELANAPS